MKTRFLALAAVALLASCANESYPVALHAICSPPEPESGGGCLYDATCPATLAGTAYLDASPASHPFPNDFELPIQINNGMPNNADATTGRTNTNDAFIQAIDLEFHGVGLAPVSLPVSFTIPAAGSTSPVLSLVPYAYFPALQASVGGGGAFLEIVVSVRGRGITGAQLKFTTPWFQVPVRVCDGCIDPANLCATGKTLTGLCPGFGQTATIKCE